MNGSSLSRKSKHEIVRLWRPFPGSDLRDCLKSLSLNLNLQPTVPPAMIRYLPVIQLHPRLSLRRYNDNILQHMKMYYIVVPFARQCYAYDLSLFF
jgi:hypothetical protein